MTSFPKAWDELHLAENPAIELLQHLGYTYVAPEVLETERASLKAPILTNRLAAALKQLNPWLSDDNVRKAVRAVTGVAAAGLAEANEKLHTTLTYGIALEQDRGEGKKNYSVRFFDFATPRHNAFLVTRQFKVVGAKKTIIADIVALVNGLPLAVIECKSPTIGDKWQSEAMSQLLRYQEIGADYRGLGAPQLFETVQLVLATCGQAAVYGTVGTPARAFAAWKEPYPLTAAQLAEQLGRAPTAQDIALYGLLSPANLLDLTRNFVVFDAASGRTVRKVCRYKQFMAVNKAMQRITSAHTPAQRGGVVWHTQGSGKSLTMLWLALKLRRDPRLNNPTLIIVTDRRDLDRQIRDTFVHCGFPNPDQAASVRHLRTLLSGPSGKAVLTTIQKFQEVLPGPTRPTGTRLPGQEHPALTEAANVFVMVDEAHRTQYRSLAANMRQALPNACFLGFTGTPIDKRDRSTLQTFGPYIDTYTIEQAVRDGATVPIFYESRLPELRILGQSLDKLFDHIFADHSDTEKQAIKQKFVTEQAIAGAPRRIDAICLDLLEHFNHFIQPNGFKAQIVAVNRDVAVTYKETLEHLNAPASALIMSTTHNDPARLARYARSREEQNRLIDRFKDPHDPLALLVVCDMLLTGFDAPVEQVLYLDAPLKEHTLLQAIARVNRKADKKDYGLVVDYWGVLEALQDALEIFAPSDVTGAMTPKTDELPRLQTRHQAVLRFFTTVRDKQDLNACVAILEPEDVRAEFDVAFRRFSQSMDMLLPDPRALPYLPDLRWLGKIRQAARARYRDPGLDLTDCGAKVRQLIEDAVIAEGMQILVQEVSLFSKEFEDKLAAVHQPDAQASEMEHAMRYEIHVKLEDNPVFYQSLRERLEAIVELRKQQRIDAAEQLKLFQALVDEMRSLGSTAAQLGLSETGYALYGLLQADDGTMTAQEAAATYNTETKELAELVERAALPRTEAVDWWQKDDLLRQMRRDIKRVLRGNVSEARLEALTAEMVDLIRRRRGRG